MPAAPKNPDVFPTPEAAASGNVPGRFVTVLGVRVRGDNADVWLLTNDRPPFEREQALLTRVEDGWEGVLSGGGFDSSTPAEVITKAEALGG
jgi:hypothetical protein